MKPNNNLRWLACTASILALAAAVWAQRGPGKVLVQIKSDYQEITILDVPGDYRQMIFDARLDGTDPIQSEMNKLDPAQLTLAYSQHMIPSLALVKNPKSILIVGLGGGCLERYLYKILPDAKITTAELDPAVLKAAQDYFAFKTDDRQVVSIGDGRKFIADSKDKYDLIMLDAFSAISIPYSLSTKEFLTLCKDHLAPGGIVSANLWEEEPTYRSMLKTYAAVFPEWYVVRCAGSTNAIVTALPEKQNLTLASWKKTAQEFDTVRRSGMNLSVLLDLGFQTKVDLPPTAKVLLDKDEPKPAPTTTAPAPPK